MKKDHVLHELHNNLTLALQEPTAHMLRLTLSRDVVEGLMIAMADTVRMDKLDAMVHSVGFEGVHESNEWFIDGPFKSIRDALDAPEPEMPEKVIPHFPAPGQPMPVPADVYTYERDRVVIFFGESALYLTHIKRDQLGNLLSGYVENGHWEWKQDECGIDHQINIPDQIEWSYGTVIEWAMVQRNNKDK